MTPGFVAAILEGFEGTLDCVLDRLEAGELKCDVTALQAHIASERERLDSESRPADVVTRTS
jgi:hypothetical protein